MKQNPAPYLRVGVTGGIGSGKSAVCTLFAKLGRTVLSADGIARSLTDTNDDIKSSIRNTFGNDVFRADGLVDRQALAASVFDSPPQLRTLNAIIHPHVFSAIEETLNKLPAEKKTPYVIIEAALIFESGMDEDLDYVIVVNADEESRVTRVMRRDNMTRDEVLSRMKFQVDVKEAMEAADFVVENDGSEADLLPRVAFLDSLIKKL